MTPLLVVGGILGLVYYVNLKTSRKQPIDPALPANATQSEAEPAAPVPHNELPPRTQGAAMGMMENYGKDRMAQIDGVPVGGSSSNVINDPHVQSFNMAKKAPIVLRPVNASAL